MAHHVILIPGDGIGPEVSAATVRMVEAAGVHVEWETIKAGAEALAEYGTPLPNRLLDSLKRSRVGLKGPVSTGIATGFPSVNVAIRKALDLYANFRPVRNLPGVKSRYQDVDLVIFRENTEDLYSGLEHEVVPGVVESLKIITERASTRIARYAFEYARQAGRKKITAIHKANIMKLSDGLFLRSCQKVAADYSGITYEEMIVDNACMQLVMRPERFDVLLLENLYGDIISDLGAGLVGGLGLVPGANMGDEHAVFEAVHGSAPDIAGQGLANPTAMMLSAMLMMRHLGEEQAANRAEAALQKVYSEGKHLTRDVGGNCSTTEFTEAVVQAM